MSFDSMARARKTHELHSARSQAGKDFHPHPELLKIMSKVPFQW
jgi:hypothetical protein